MQYYVHKIIYTIEENYHQQTLKDSINFDITTLKKKNQKWEKNPHANNKEIVYGYPQPYDKKLKSYDFYV